MMNLHWPSREKQLSQPRIILNMTLWTDTWRLEQSFSTMLAAGLVFYFLDNSSCFAWVPSYLLNKFSCFTSSVSTAVHIPMIHHGTSIFYTLLNMTMRSKDSLWYSLAADAGMLLSFKRPNLCISWCIFNPQIQQTHLYTEFLEL